MELFFCECTFFTATLEAVVYSVAVSVQKQGVAVGGVAEKKKEMWFYDYKSHRFSSEG